MITVVGAGPAGAYAGYLLAKAGQDVTILEEHDIIGSPIQCTGIVTQSINNIVPVRKDTIINTIRTARIYSAHRKVEVDMKHPNYILDRTTFDGSIAAMAQDAGAHIQTHTKFLGNTGKEVRTSTGTFSSDYIIGADGPLSIVAKSNNLFTGRKPWLGLQATAKLDNDNAIEFYTHHGEFSWVVPEDESTVRIGIMAYDNARDIFRSFVKKRLGENPKLLCHQGGLVPVYNPKPRAQNGNVFLVGDAAVFYDPIFPVVSAWPCSLRWRPPSFWCRC